ncbi:alpha-ketoacid dehydrogenase subunit beta, partial [Candidatus Bathyarchaeota archaeon]
TPISETAIIGVAIGAAITGMRPVAEIMYSSFLGVCMDQIYNQAAKLPYISGGQICIPIVIRTVNLSGFSAAAQHEERNEVWFMHTPGIKVVLPSTPYDAKGLLLASIWDDNPVIFFEHGALYPVKGPVPEKEYMIELGKADVKREGEDVTVVSYSWFVQKALKAADMLEKEGISVEVVDLRTLTPLDKKTIIESVKKTGRVVVFEEDVKTAGVGAEISATIVEEAFDYLDAPIKRVAALDTPTPFSPPLLEYVIPAEDDLIRAVKEVVGYTF